MSTVIQLRVKCHAHGPSSSVALGFKPPTFCSVVQQLNHITSRHSVGTVFYFITFCVILSHIILEEPGRNPCTMGEHGEVHTALCHLKSVYFFTLSKKIKLSPENVKTPLNIYHKTYHKTYIIYVTRRSCYLNVTSA